MSVRVSRILHAGYLFESEDVRIVFDPIFENPFSRNCYAFPQVEFDLGKIRDQRFDAVFISHYHDDHCSFESLKQIDRDTPIYLYCVYEELFDWIRELGFQKVYSLELGLPVKIDPFEIVTREALDADVDSIFHIKAHGLNILNVVDSWIGPSTLNQLMRTSDWDLILWPFQTMREMEVLSPSRSMQVPTEIPEEWLEQLKILKPNFLIPSSCQFQMEDGSWYNQAFFPIKYADFENAMKFAIPETHVFRLNPSETIVLEKGRVIHANQLEWVKLIGDANKDYDFNPCVPVPSTSDIAKTFAPLSKSESNLVHGYCKLELPRKIKSLAPSAHEYFEKARLWNLLVYDHNGIAKSYHYKIQNENVLEVSNSQVSLMKASWSTEVPEATLYGALQRGESLTSMYIRVNDMRFDDEIEKDLQDVDPIEDPLIRSLYQGIFGSYQLAQLKRIISN